ncbi:hypothetical protein SAMN04515671_4097 [Nakamurella panacisegetis]|uniref:Uncharacterized protein n=1 Tax=Nakamurella panacisegetis TaxID=1090615 RepID=A0A1H0SGY4_9ACTN|nr:hypothetical protein [Nakamurella panacisegetis]SDP40957.1 hypothetical protein SAMN04515671_4097 [Nakamurella panacisegetis]
MSASPEKNSPEVAAPDHSSLIAGLRSFIARHGGGGTAVLNHMGRRGVRIVVISADGPFTDGIVPDLEQAGAVCAAAGLSVGQWDRESTGKITVSAADRIRMAGTGR